MLNSKKRTIVIAAAVIVAIVCVVAIFVVRARTLPVSFANIHITWAITEDLRPNDPLARELTDEQIDELKSRLSLLKPGKRDDDLLGLTPFYTLSVDSPEIGRFMIACYDSYGKHMAIIYQEKAYRLEDNAFWAYLSAVCAGSADSEQELISPNPTECF